VRLDHLLSKEHTARPRVRLEVGELPRRALESWRYGSFRPLRSFRENFFSERRQAPPVPGPPKRHCSVLRECVSRRPVCSTDAGVSVSPQGSALEPATAQFGSGRERSRDSTPRLRSDRWSRTPLENCRASTSIFTSNRRKDLPSYKEPTVDALAPDADEGRGRLR
jgi:hypothetical protein